MSSYVGTALRAAYPDFHVLTEPAHLALRDHAGVPMHEACVIFRNNPFLDRRGANVFMLATLCEDGPQFGSSRLSRLIVRLTERHRASPAETAKTWFANFIRVAIEPVLMARSNFGLLFGAHQQNLLLRLLDGWPNASYYRDAFGTCFVDEMYEQLSPAVSGECLSGHGRVPREIGDRSFTHNLMVNNVLNVIATLGHSGLVTESDLLQVLKRRLWRMHQRSLLDSSFMEHLLNHPTIPAKANFLTVLHDVDENRSASERTGLEALYVDLPNPLKLETAL
jgi:N2-citryl-N6-acetyl-N6-hydroxylysine synthase